MTPYWTSSDGRHVLYCGNCIDVLPTLPKVDAVVTDPPYGIGKWNHTGGNSISAEEASAMKSWDAMPADAELLRTIIALCPVAVVWGGNYFGIGPCRAPLVWDKAIRGMHFADGEMAWTSFDWGTLRILNYPIASGDTKNAKLHPTQKPIRVMEWSIQNTRTEEGALVLDPFMGSGTTGVACIKLGRKFIGIEISKDYCDIAVQRMERELSQPQLPGLEPHKAVQGTML